MNFRILPKHDRCLFPTGYFNEVIQNLTDDNLYKTLHFSINFADR